MKLHIKSPLKIGISLLAVLLVLGITLSAVRATSVAAADNTVQMIFATPEEAGQALQSAAQANDESALAQILGSEAKAILVHSGFLAWLDHMNCSSRFIAW